MGRHVFCPSVTCTHQWPRASLSPALLCKGLCIPQRDHDSVPRCHLDRQENRLILKWMKWGQMAIVGEKKHTRWAVVKVKVSTEHIKNHFLIRLSGGCLEIANPIGDHVQLLAADRSFTLLKKNTHMPFMFAFRLSQASLKMSLTFWCMKVDTVEITNQFLLLHIFPDQHLKIKQTFFYILVVQRKRLRPECHHSGIQPHVLSKCASQNSRHARDHKHWIAQGGTVMPEILVLVQIGYSKREENVLTFYANSKSWMPFQMKRR